MAEVDFEGELDGLYELPLNEFTSARDELARELRAQGEREQAAEIKRLRKPAASVWVVNQLARERPLDVQRLLKAGESLTKSPTAEARGAEQHALEQLADAAREIAERAGIGAPALVKVTETLRAASLTPDGRELLRRGRLTEELEPPGFEALTGSKGPGRQAAPAKRSQDRGAKRRAVNQARERIRELRAEERELAGAARAAAREAERAEAEAGEARERATAAETKAEATSEARKAAEAELDRLG